MHDEMLARGSQTCGMKNEFGGVIFSCLRRIGDLNACGEVGGDGMQSERGSASVELRTRIRAFAWQLRQSQRIAVEGNHAREVLY